MSTIRKRRNSSLLTLAGAAVAMPASAAVITHTLSTPLTIGGLETIETSGVDEFIWFNPKTDDIESLRRKDSSTSPPMTSDLIVLAATTRVAGVSNKPMAALALGNNTRFMALGSFSAGTTTSVDPFMTMLLERLDAGRSIGAASNWGIHDQLTDGSTTLPGGIGYIFGPDFFDKELLPVPSSQLWGSGARGSIGFAMDAFVPTGNMIDGPNPKASATWADPNVPEYVKIPETVPSFEHALYGWAEIGMGASGITLYGYSYDDSGASIETLAAGRPMDISAVPEPANVLTLASLLGGSLLLRSRRRAPVSAADA